MLFKFKIEDMKKLHKHTIENPNSNIPEPSFLLIAQNGIYMTSVGMRSENELFKELDVDVVVYAQGFNPNLASDKLLCSMLEKSLSEFRTSNVFSQMIPLDWLDMVVEGSANEEFFVLKAAGNNVILMLD